MTAGAEDELLPAADADADVDLDAVVLAATDPVPAEAVFDPEDVEVIGPLSVPPAVAPNVAE